MQFKQICHTLLLGLICLQTNLLTAQLVINSSIPSDGDLGICVDSSEFSFSIEATIASVNDVDIEIHMPPGINYVSSSLVNNIAGSENVHFNSLTNNVLTLDGDDMTLGDSYDFTFSVSADCEALEYVLSGESLHDTINVFFNTSNFVQDSTDAFTNSIAYPILSINQPSSPSGNLGDALTRSVTINNAGTGCLREVLWYDAYEADIMVDSVYFLGSKLNTYQNGDTIFYQFGSTEFAQIGDADERYCLIDGALTLVEYITILGCDDKGSVLGASWGCDGSTVCESFTANGEVSLSGDQPNLTFNFPNSGLPDCFHEQANEEVMIISNNGAGTATGIEIEIKKFYYAGQFADYKYDGLDTSTVELRYNSGSYAKVAVKNVEANTYYNACSQPYIYRFTVDTPDMDPGDSVFIRFDMINCEPTECGDGSIKQGAWGYNYRYSTTCSGGETVISNRQADLGAVLSWFMTNYDNPTIPNGVTSILSSTVQTAQISYPGDGQYVVRFELPDCGLNFSGDSTELYWRNISGDILWPQVSFTHEVDTVEAIFNAVDQPSDFSMAGSEINLVVTGACDCIGTDTLQSITKAIRYIPDPSCTNPAEIELYCEDVEYIVDQCAVISCDGMKTDSFSFARTTVGLPDNDFNRQPEAGSVDLSAIRTDRVRLGDTISCSLRGIVEGSQSFQYGNAEITFDIGEYVASIGGSVKIWDASTSSYLSCDSLPVRKIGTDRFLFTFSPDSLSSRCVAFSGFNFAVGDSLWIFPQFIIDSTSNNSIDIGKVYPIKLYLSQVADPTNADQAICGSSKYSAKFQIIPMVDNSFITSSSSTSCDGVQAKTNFNLFTGGSYTDMFPSEYRTWSFPDTLYVVPPDSFTYQSAYLFLRFSPYSKSYTPIPVDPNADTLLFDLKSLIDLGTIIRPDDGYELQFYTTWKPQCDADGSTDIVVPLLSDLYWEPGLELYDSARNYSPIIRHTDPSLQIINSSSSTQDGVSDEVEWTIQLQNTSSTSDAPYTWIAFSSPSGDITVSNLSDDTGGGGSLTPSGGIYQLGATGRSSSRTYTISASYLDCNIDTLYAFAGWNCSSYPASLAEHACDIDTFILRVDPKPAAAQIAITSAPSGSVALCTDLSFELQVSTTNIANIENLLLDVYHPGGGIEIVKTTSELEYPLASGYLAVSDPDSISGGFRFDLSTYNASLSSDGLQGLGSSAAANSRSFNIQFDIQTNCDFLSGDVIYMSLSGTRPCGDAVSVLRTSDAIEISGIASPYTTNIGITADTLRGCGEPSTIQVKLYPVGGTTGSSDKIRVTIPENINYEDNFTALYQAPSDGSLVTTSVGSLGTQLTWDMPASIVSGDSILFSFDISTDSSTSCSNTSKYLSVNTTFTATVSCDGAFCSDYFGSTGNSASYLTIQKPDLSIDYLAHSSNQSGGNSTYTIRTILLNEGISLDGTDSSTVEYYCDADSSGDLSAGDSYLGSFKDKIAVPSGDIYLYTMNMTVPTTSCGIDRPLLGVIRQFPANSSGPVQCVCDTFYSRQASDITLPIKWLSFRGMKHGKGNQLIWEIELDQESDFFEVYRKPLGFPSWEEIGKVNIEEVQASAATFRFVDHSAFDTYVYRIAHVDQNGTYDYSSSLYLNRHSGMPIQVYPNPNIGLLHIDSSIPVEYRLYDVLGQTCLFGKTKSEQEIITVNHLPKGLYLLEVLRESELFTIKIILE